MNLRAARHFYGEKGLKNSEPVTNQRDEVEIKLTRTGLLVARGILLSSNTLCPLSSHPNLMLTSEDSMKFFTPLSILKRKKGFQCFPPRGKT